MPGLRSRCRGQRDPAMKGRFVTAGQQGRAKTAAQQDQETPDFLRAGKCVLRTVCKQTVPLKTPSQGEADSYLLIVSSERLLK